MFDLYSSPPEMGYIEALREEAAHILAEEEGVWTKAGLAKMLKMDSALRESMRLGGGGARRLTRKVNKHSSYPRRLCYRIARNISLLGNT